MRDRKTTKAGAETAPRLVKRFDWTAVNPRLLRRMLEVRYRERPSDLERLARTQDEGLPAVAARTLGSPPRPRALDKELAQLLREEWIPTARATELRPFAENVCESVYGTVRHHLVGTQTSRKTFLLKRNLTHNYIVNLRKAFIAAHKTLQPAVTTTTPTVHSSEPSRTVVDGLGEGGDRLAFDHQRLAWRRLDEFTERSEHVGALLALPTGAGKTYTAVSWLLDRIAEGDRVLWIADQTELVDQATREFARQGRTLPTERRFVVRTVHGAAARSTALADPEADVVCATRQSLFGRDFDAQRKNAVRAFVSARPTIVVVDEAHHAVSPTYQQLIAFIAESAPTSRFVGLTATPWPAGFGRTRLLLDTFPFEAARVDVLDMVRQGILATPHVHTLHTGTSVDMTEEEARQALKSDIPASVLRSLDASARNDFVVGAWLDRRDEWGKTLVFACDIRHADSLYAHFQDNDTPAYVVHSQAEIHQSTVIDDFKRHEGPAVLVSVGMLLEGVDIPSARTAFLVRPTRSRVLMRQMVGRVLRGPEAGGSSIAHIVDMRDNWGRDVGVLSPIDLPDLGAGVSGRGGRFGVTDGLPSIPDPDTGESIPDSVLQRILEQYWRAVAARLLDASLNEARLVGYFQLPDINVPVFEHVEDRWAQITEGAVTGGLTDRSAMRLVDDLPDPRPTPEEVKAVVGFCQSYLEAPPLHRVTATFSMRQTVDDFVAQPPMTPLERSEWLRDTFEHSLAMLGYPSFSRFREAFDHQLAARFEEVLTADPEAPRVVEGQGLPKLRRSAQPRDLEVLLGEVLDEGTRLLAKHEIPERGTVEGESGFSDRLAEAGIHVGWTRTPVKGFWASWTLGGWRVRDGKAMIRVNSRLDAPRSQVPDALLKFLLWHEVCHHLLPGQGHDAQFRELESLWPDAAAMDHALDALSEKYDVGWGEQSG